jgi:hypothetical protein
MAVDFVNQMFDLARQETDNKLAAIDIQYERERTAIEASTLGEQQKAASIEALDKQVDSKKRALMIKQAKRDKAAALFGAVIGGAQAIINGFNTKPFFPLGIIMGALAAVLTAVQVGVVAARPIPALAEGGLIPATPGGIQVTAGEGGQDELVLPMKTGIREIVRGVIEGIAGAVLPPASPGLAFAGGGGAALASSSRVGDLHLHVGTLIADDWGLKNLERTLYKFRIAEAQRKGQA